jgi:RNA polymerase sigma factor (sigma-70 family)
LIAGALVEEITDIDLVALARNGDKDAFGLLAERYQMMAHRFAMRLVTNADLAHELAQEAMLQAYLSLDHLRDPARFKAWLFGIVSNVCRSHLRDRRVAFFSLEAMAGGLQFDAMPFSGTAPTPQEIAEQRELHQTVLDAINELPLKDRDATLLFYYDQLSLQEIAALLDVSVGAVKVRLHRARQRLKARLLSQYPEIIPRQQRRKIMIKVTVADVVKSLDKALYVIVVHDEAGHRALPIWVGPFEGQSIAMGLAGFSTPRPMTFSFLANLLQAIDARVEEVRVEKLQGDTFYAVVKIRCGALVSEMEARPSDAIALAVRTGSPIYVAEDVLERGGIDIPPAAKASVARNGVEGILREIGQVQPSWVREPQKESHPEVSEEEVSRAKEWLVAHIFRD